MINPFETIKPIEAFQREAEEFEARKRQRMLEEQIAQGKLSMLPFEQHKMQAEAEVMRKQAEMGISTNDPAAIREWKIYSQLPQDQQARYLQMKRADQLMNLGGNVAVRSPMGGIAEQYPVTPRPEQMPDFQAEQERAKKEAAGLADIETERAKKSEKAGIMLDLVGEAETLLPMATSGIVGRGVTGVQKVFGKSTDASRSDARLKVIAAALTSNVPRMEGPQGVLDVELYKQAAGDVANSEIPYEDRLSALQTIKDLQNKYAGNTSQQPVGIQIDTPAPAVQPMDKYSQEEAAFNERKGKKKTVRFEDLPE